MLFLLDKKFDFNREEKKMSRRLNEVLDRAETTKDFEREIETLSKRYSKAEILALFHSMRSYLPSMKLMILSKAVASKVNQKGS